MTARDSLEGVASLLLMLAMIILCLLFAVYDRLAVLVGGPRRGIEPGGGRPAVPVLGRR